MKSEESLWKTVRKKGAEFIQGINPEFSIDTFAWSRPKGEEIHSAKKMPKHETVDCRLFGLKEIPVLRGAGLS